MSLASLPQSLFFLVIGILGIGFIIAFHELGHFLFCKLFNIHTPSFSIGFGPRLISKKVGTTEFKISAIPLGGYVEIAGSAEPGQGEQKNATSNDEDSFATKPFWQKFLVMFGGILFNMIFAYFTFALVFMAGLPKSRMLAPLTMTPTISLVADDSAAQKGGLKVGDTILAIEDQEVGDNVEKLLGLLKPLADQKVSLRIEREGKEKTIKLTTGSREFMGEKMASLGVDFELQALPGKSFIDSIKEGIALTNRFVASTFKAFKHIFTKRDVKQMGGPIMIIAATAKGAGQGFKIFFIFLAIISINLAVLNLIPLPILDGGQILFHSIEALFGRQLPIKVREYIAIASWIGFLLLFVYLSAQDIYRLGGVYIQKALSLIGL